MMRSMARLPSGAWARPPPSRVLQGTIWRSESTMAAAARALAQKPTMSLLLSRVASAVTRTFGPASSASVTGTRAESHAPSSGEQSASFSSGTAAWTNAVCKAEAVALPKHEPKLLNPMELLASEMGSLTTSIKTLLAADHALLRRMAQYYFDQNGKKVRPLIVLLISQAAAAAATAASVVAPPLGSGASPTMPPAYPTSFAFIDQPMSPAAMVGDPNLVAEMGGPGHYVPNPLSRGILPTQRRLAEITEMIHTASLLHDDVIDHADTRRGVPTINAEQGNKLAILAGDFLLARASVALARLRQCEVVELMATAIANLVEGEVLQLRNTADPSAARTMLSASAIENINPQFDHYMEKTYMKTASLIANSCRAATVLGGYPEPLRDAAYHFGKHFGLAFQLIDDLLDFTGCATTFGKPAGGADLQLGLATAPVLYAAEEYAELRPLIARRFSEQGDVALAFERVHASQGLQLTRELAAKHARAAADALAAWPDSPAREALVQLTHKVLTRTR